MYKYIYNTFTSLYYHKFMTRTNTEEALLFRSIKKKKNDLKSISAPNVRGDFLFHVAMQPVFLANFLKPPIYQKRQNVFCRNVNNNLDLYKLKFLLKNTCSIMTTLVHIFLSLS